jgi:hypothetical protein
VLLHTNSYPFSRSCSRLFANHLLWALHAVLSHPSFFSRSHSRARATYTRPTTHCTGVLLLPLLSPPPTRASQGKPGNPLIDETALQLVNSFADVLEHHTPLNLQLFHRDDIGDDGDADAQASDDAASATTSSDSKCPDPHCHHDHGETTTTSTAAPAPAPAPPATSKPKTTAEPVSVVASTAAHNSGDVLRSVSGPALPVLPDLLDWPLEDVLGTGAADSAPADTGEGPAVLVDRATRVSRKGAVTWWHLDDCGEFVLQAALPEPGRKVRSLAAPFVLSARAERKGCARSQPIRALRFTTQSTIFARLQSALSLRTEQNRFSNSLSLVYHAITCHHPMSKHTHRVWFGVSRQKQFVPD